MRSFSNQKAADNEDDEFHPDDDSCFRDNMFQTELLCRRKDFLNLCVIVRKLANDMHLTNSVENRYTRQFLHQRNAAHCFFMLSSRYATLNSEFGMMYCQQTRTTLRNYFSICRFMGLVIKTVFLEAFSGNDGKCSDKFLDDSRPWPKGDSSQPLITLMKQLDEKIVQSIDEHTEPKVRAEALLQIMDLVLKTPLPYPRGFMVMKSIPFARVRLSGCPQNSTVTTDDIIEDDCDDEAEVIEIQAGTTFTLHASGCIPQEYFQKTDLMFSQLIAYHTITFDGPIEDEGDGDDHQFNTDQTTESRLDQMSDQEESAFITNLLPTSCYVTEDGKDARGSKFFSSFVCAPIHQEGYYMMDLKLGLRDVRCGEYKIPKKENSGVIFLKVLFVI